MKIDTIYDIDGEEVVLSVDVYISPKSTSFYEKEWADEFTILKGFYSSNTKKLTKDEIETLQEDSDFAEYIREVIKEVFYEYK